MSDILKSLGIGAGAGVVNNALAGVNAMISFKRQKELMSMQNAANRANARDAAALQVEGLRMAGFNPAMVQGAGTAAAPTVSQGNADMPQTIPFDPNTALLLAEKDKIEEETRGVKQANDITDAANDAAVRGYLSDFNKEQEDLEARLKTLPEGSEEYNKLSGRIKEIEKIKSRLVDPEYSGALGFVRGTQAAAENTKHRMDILGNYLKGAMDNAVARKELSNGTVDALATMKKAQRDKLAEDIKHVQQLIAESESKEKLNDAMINEIAQKIIQIGDAVHRAQLSDENYVRDNQAKWNRNLKILDDAGYDKNDPDYIKVKDQAEMWNTRFENLTDTELRKTLYETGSGVIKGVAAGGAAGAVSSLAQKMLNGEKITKEDLKGLGKDSQYDWNGSGYENGNIRRETPLPGASVGERPQGVSQFDWNRVQKESNRKSR